MNAIENIKSTTGTLRFSWENDVCIIDFHDESKSMNSFSQEILKDLDAALDAIFARPSLAGVVFTSTKPGVFAAGVDVGIFDTLRTKEDGADAARSLQRLGARFAAAPVPTVAAINGTCLGGALELSLAMQHRVCSTHPSTQLGLPEVQLGILPGGGGTQRLPRLIGIAPALDLILTGKKVDARKALKLGIVEEAVPENQLIARAVKIAKATKPAAKKSGVKMSLVGHSMHMFSSFEKGLADVDITKFALESNMIGRSLIEKKSLEQIEKSTKGFYPAPKKALEAVMRGISKSLEEGLEIEAKLFGELVASPESRALVHIFRIMTSAKKNPYGKEAQGQARKLVMEPLLSGRSPVGILGAGLMGSGIATVLADKGMRSVLLDREPSGVQRGLKGVSSYFEDKVRKRRLKRFEALAAASRVMPALEYKSLRGTPIVIEAVFEDVKVKHDVLRQCEESLAGEPFIFATNTSSLPIADIAAGAKAPWNVVGMHFFSPVPKMPLVEIITTEKTTDIAASAVFELASKMGKNIVVVKDGPGFYTTRILAFLIGEAMSILAEGASIEDIDGALEKFGMPVGPITLLDEVGIDVGNHIISVLSKPFGERLVIPKELEAIVGEDRRGRKNSFGFYTYLEGKKDKPDKTIYRHLKHGQERKPFDRQEIVDRCVFAFMNEAARCLDEGIIRSADDGDLGAVFGLGFPPFLGGPFFYGNTLGRAHVKDRLETLAKKYGPRFAPAAWWSK
ncbi:MAG: enoyl-CoA hydratase/isomerase family protein [Silvanigrellales bacterium]|nr:enoyl-CoA hydratase/isomerase family protein [Silvanigrellales bacterium]